MYIMRLNIELHAGVRQKRGQNEKVQFFPRHILTFSSTSDITRRNA